MKKTVGIALFIFFVILTIIFVGGLVFHQNNNTNNKLIINTANNINTKPKLNMAEVSKHNNINDCYMVIGGKVYDITPYFGSHPGGDRAMVPYCGKESTMGYDTKGGRGGGHSSYAHSLLAQYFIGNLVQ